VSGWNPLRAQASSPPRADQRDTVYLESGRKVRGLVVLELDSRVAVLVGSREQWIARSKIARIESIANSQRELLGKFDKATDSVSSFLDLARFCDKRHLNHEARLFHWRILLDQPDHAGAHKALGHRSTKQGWRVMFAGGLRTMEQLEKVHSEWGKAWKLRSEHFKVRTDTGLRRAVYTLFELEYFYRHLFDLFQVDLELRELTKPIQVYLYKNRKQFPSLSSTSSAFFSPGENILYTFATRRGRPRALFHEATHAVLYNLTGGARAGRGRVPAWLDEGWAEFNRSVMVPARGGRVRLDLARRLTRRLQAVRSTKEAYSLHRVLNFKADDFVASSKQGLKYGQSYALFLYMMTGADGALLPEFLQYMREALSGKGQASTFRRMFRKNLTAIEKSYRNVR
jgi:hypothetical protein